MKSVTPPWLVALRGKGSRLFGFALAGADAFISYSGMVARGADEFSALVMALLILLFQSTVAWLVTSGAPIGAEFQQRFFADQGIVGAIKRAIGGFLIFFTIGIYAFDISTNWLALTGGQWNPPPATFIDLFFYATASVGLALGDELLHLLADITATVQEQNQSIYDQEIAPKQIRNVAASAYYKEARKIAEQLGRQSSDAVRSDIKSYLDQISRPPN